MLGTIIAREIRHNFLSLRFHISFIITLMVFGFGTIAFLANYKAGMEEYTKYQNELRSTIQGTVEKNLTTLAVKRQDFILKPRANAFITGSKEKYIPNSITFSAFNVFEFEARKGSTNPYLNLFQELDWGFIVSIILSFTVFLFTFNSISGEKETRTLAVSLANSVSRGTLLIGKYLSTIVTALFIVIPGLCLSLIILLFSGVISISPATILEILGFILASGIFVSCIAAFGLLSSVMVKNSDVSLLIALIMWVLFVVIIPNSAIFLSQTIYPIDNSDTINEKMQSAKDAIEKNAPDGRWSMMHDQPFFKFHQIRATHQTNLMNSDMQILNAYYHDMFRQLEHARLLTYISPVSLFEYLCEADVGGGYVRFQHVWDGLHAYQIQFLTFFKEKDAQDKNSPHWYNPREDVSTTRKPVKFEEVPVFQEKVLTYGERFARVYPYGVVILLYTAVVFSLTFVLFIRYDVR